MKNFAEAVSAGPLTSENYESSYLSFGNRQAGVSLVYAPDENFFYYNAYCIEQKLTKEIFSNEFKFLEEALHLINSEFGSWTLETFDQDNGCGSCAAK